MNEQIEEIQGQINFPLVSSIVDSLRNAASCETKEDLIVNLTEAKADLQSLLNDNMR